MTRLLEILADFLGGMALLIGMGLGAAMVPVAVMVMLR